jgi:hypothetical protein
LSSVDPKGTAKAPGRRPEPEGYPFQSHWMDGFPMHLTFLRQNRAKTWEKCPGIALESEQPYRHQPTCGARSNQCPKGATWRTAAIFRRLTKRMRRCLLASLRL